MLPAGTADCFLGALWYTMKKKANSCGGVPPLRSGGHHGRKQRPRILLKSVRYPTSQLWAAAGNLIRIYFLYDSQRDVIVVGSLPYHLKVAQIKA